MPAPLILLDTEIVIGGYRLSTRSNEVAIDYAADTVPVPAFAASGWTNKRAGLKSGGLSMSGYHDDETEDADELNGVWDAVGGAAQVISFAPAGFDDADPLAWCQGISGAMNHAGQVGGALAFDLSAEITGLLIANGYVGLEHSSTGIATVNGTAIVAGAVTAAQNLYMLLQILTATTATIAAYVESSATGAYAGEETVRASLTGKTTIGGWMATPVAGPITDTHWRARLTVAGLTAVSRALIGFAIL